MNSRLTCKNKFKPLALLLLLVSVPSRGDVYDHLLKDPTVLPEELQIKLVNKTPEAQKEIMTIFYTNISKQLQTAGLGIYSTKVKNKSGDLFTAERMELHESIIKEFLGEENTKKAALNRKPKLLILAGAPGAGKSTVVKQLEAKNSFKKEDYVYLDPDEIRARLPQYTKWTNRFKNENPEMLEKISQFTQAEANYLTDEIYARAVKQRKNIVRDGTMRNIPFFSKVISEASMDGYETGILHVDVTKPTALARVESRARQTGRKVNQNFFDIANPEIINTSAEYLKRLSDFYIKINNETHAEVEDCRINITCSENNVASFMSKLKELNPVTDEKVKRLLDGLTCVPSPIGSSDRQVSSTRVPIDQLGSASTPLKNCMKQLSIHTAVGSFPDGNGCRVKTPAEEILPENQKALRKVLSGC